MTHRMFVLILALLAAQSVSVQAATPKIDGAFGIKLGDTPSHEYRPGKVQTNVGILYFIEPPIKNEHFNEYAVLTTKSTNKIYSIYAEKEQKTAKCQEELLKVKQSLEKLYGNLSVQDGIHAIKQDKREISLTCKISTINKDDASLQIKYVDHQIYEDSLDKTDPNRRDASGL